MNAATLCPLSSELEITKHANMSIMIYIVMEGTESDQACNHWVQPQITYEQCASIG